MDTSSTATYIPDKKDLNIVGESQTLGRPARLCIAKRIGGSQRNTPTIGNQHHFVRHKGVPIEKFQLLARGGANGKIPDFKRGSGRVGSGWGVGQLFVLGTLEAGKHDVNNVNNVQCLMTVPIGEILSPEEETRHKDPRETPPTNPASEDDSSSECQPDDEPTSLNPKAAVKIAFIYHVSYGSLLFRCHHVVNKGCRLSPSASLWFLCGSCVYA